MSIVLVEIVIVFALFAANGVFVGERPAGAPREGDTFVCAGLRFEIIDMDRTSVDKILIQPEPAQVEKLA